MRSQKSFAAKQRRKSMNLRRRFFTFNVHFIFSASWKLRSYFMYYFLSDFFFEKKASSLGTRGVRIDRENLLMLTKLYSKMVCVHCSCPYD